MDNSMMSDSPPPATAATGAAAAAAAPTVVGIDPEVVIADVNKMVNALTALYAENGDDAAPKFAMIENALSDFFTAAVVAVQEKKESYRTAIQNDTAAAAELCGQLGETQALNQMAAIDEKLPLRTRAEAVSKIVADLTQKKSLRQSVMANFTALSVTMAREMQEVLSPEYASVGTDFSKARLLAVENKHNALKLLCGERTQQVSFAVADIDKYWTELGVDRVKECTSPLEVQMQKPEPGKLGISRDIIAQLDAIKDKLAALKATREAEAKSVFVTLNDLWTRLNVPTADRKAFVDSVQKATLTPATMQLYAAELSRMMAMKSANAKALVEQVRTQIAKYWNDLHLSDEEKRAAFPAFFADVFTDASLSSHEQYLVSVRARHTECAGLLRDIATREQYRTQIQDHWFNKANPEMTAMLFSGPKGFKAREQLQVIETIISKKAPKLDTKIVAQLKAFAEAKHEWTSDPVFYYDGENYAQTIARQQADDRAAEAQRKAEAKEAAEKKKARPSDVNGMANKPTGPRMSMIGTGSGAAAGGGNSRLSCYTPSKAVSVSAISAAVGATPRGSMYLRSSTKVLAPSNAAASAANRPATAAAPASAKANKPTAAASASGAASSQAARYGLPAAPLFDTPMKAAVTGVKLGAAAASANLAANAAANAAQAAANLAATLKPKAAAPAAAAAAAAAAPAPVKSKKRKSEETAPTPAPAATAAASGSATARPATAAPAVSEQPATKKVKTETKAKSKTGTAAAGKSKKAAAAAAAVETKSAAPAAAAAPLSARRPATAGAASVAAAAAKPAGSKKAKAAGAGAAKKSKKAAAAGAAAAKPVRIETDLKIENFDAEEDKENAPAPVVAVTPTASASSTGFASVKKPAATTPAASASSSSPAATPIAGEIAQTQSVLDGKAAVDRGDWKAAIKIYTSGIAAASSNAELCALYHGRSQALLNDNDFDRAMVDSTRAMKAMEDHKQQLAAAAAAVGGDE